MRGGNMRPVLLDRSRLCTLYENFYQNSVIFITAPIGYGKTTSLRAFLNRQTDIFYRAFTFREGEKDEFWFWKRFNEMLMADYPEAESVLRDLPLPQTDEEILLYFAKLEKLIKREAFCVLDDYHECDSPALNKILAAAAYERPSRLHIVVMGRSMPSISVEELALKASCLIVDQTDLVFTKNEVRELAAINEITLSEEQLDWCMEYSGGWGAAISLLLTEYRQTGRMTHSMNVRTLIHSSILKRLGEKQREILECLSVIKSFLPEQAVYLTGESAAPEIIQQIREDYGFISVREDRVCEIAALLREAAVASFLRSGHTREEVYLKNAHWYEDMRDYVPAIRYYSLAEEIESIHRLMDQQDAIEFIHDSPKIMKDAVGAFQAEKRHRIQSIYSTPEVLTVFHKQTGNYYNTYKGLLQKLGRVIGTQEGAHSGWEPLLEAEYLYQTGDIDQTIRLAEEAYTIASWKKENIISIAAALLRTKSYFYWNTPEMIRKTSSKMEATIEDSNELPIIRSYELGKVLLFGLYMPLSQFPEWIRKGEIPDISRIFAESGSLQRAFGYYYIRESNYEKLNVLADEMLSESQIGSFVFRQIHGHIFKALAFWKKPELAGGVVEASIDQMQQAVGLAQPDGIKMTFAEYGQLILPLLVMVRQNDFTAQLIQRCKKYGQGQEAYQMLMQPVGLTERETDIMELVAEGMTNVQISEELHLARITIEKNLSAIYKKYEVKNRASALMKYNEEKV